MAPQEQMQELVVLVDEDNTVLGTMPKSEVHQKETLLHRAFSSFIFRVSDGKFLLQQRSSTKKTWPLMWSNSCCGHPAPDEDNVSAAYRRLEAELGLHPIALEEVSPYRYCFSHLDVMENEICPILVGFVDGEPALNPDEVEAVRWVDWQDFIAEVKRFPARYSEWCVEETLILEKNGRLQELLKTHIR
ncbi:MAG: isopentenyl-diphosphate Delta-isomerase [Candidatus Moranbacteria bacterium]|nr:isopentenyl-diphosphate Delta-isomerase [Candidatus Moranbacteria bacterium]